MPENHRLQQNRRPSTYVGSDQGHKDAIAIHSAAGEGDQVNRYRYRRRRRRAPPEQRSSKVCWTAPSWSVYFVGSGTGHIKIIEGWIDEAKSEKRKADTKLNGGVAKAKMSPSYIRSLLERVTRQTGVPQPAPPLLPPCNVTY
jgi:hypothetical protein